MNKKTQKSILIVGGTHSDIPLIQSAKRQGFYVFTIGNNTQDVGHQYSDEYHPIDYSNPEVVCQFVQQQGIDYVCPSCSDFSLISTVHVAHKLQLPGNYDKMDTLLTLLHKDKFRKFSLANNISSPRAQGFDNVKEALQTIKNWQFPLLSKPPDLGAGRGFAKIETMEAAESAIHFSLNCSRIGRVVVEEFLQGSTHSFTAVLKNQKVAFYFSGNELYYHKNPFRGSGFSCPTNVSKISLKKITAEVEKIASLLDLKDGNLHTQFILTDQGPVMVEGTRRLPGDYSINLIKHATGFDLADCLIKSWTGQNIANLIQVEPKGYFLRHCIMSEKNGQVTDVVYDPWIKDKIIEQCIMGKVGDQIEDMRNYYYGMAIFKFDSLAELNSLQPKIQKFIKIQIKNT